MANRKQVIAGLEAAELVITQDAFLDTETNRYADILLPGALWAEAEGVMINSERNMTLMQQAVAAPGEAMADWQIIASVACEMGFAEGFTYASAAEVFAEITQTSNRKTGYEIRGISMNNCAANRCNGRVRQIARPSASLSVTSTMAYTRNAKSMRMAAPRAWPLPPRAVRACSLRVRICLRPSCRMLNTH